MNKHIDKYLIVSFATVGGGSKKVRIYNPEYFILDKERLKRYEKTVKQLERI